MNEPYRYHLRQFKALSAAGKIIAFLEVTDQAPDTPPHTRHCRGRRAPSPSPVLAGDGGSPFCVLAPLLQVRTYSGMNKSRKLRPPVLTAGGIVVRETSEPLIAVVRLRKDKSWVLPKGKLKPGEDARVGARREVMEGTGYDAQACSRAP
jgi:hypothetical protein